MRAMQAGEGPGAALSMKTHAHHKAMPSFFQDAEDWKTTASQVRTSSVQDFAGRFARSFLNLRNG